MKTPKQINEHLLKLMGLPTYSHYPESDFRNHPDMHFIRDDDGTWLYDPATELSHRGSTYENESQAWMVVDHLGSKLARFTIGKLGFHDWRCTLAFAGYPPQEFAFTASTRAAAISTALSEVEI